MSGQWDDVRSDGEMSASRFLSVPEHYLLFHRSKWPLLFEWPADYTDRTDSRFHDPEAINICLCLSSGQDAIEASPFTAESRRMDTNVPVACVVGVRPVSHPESHRNRVYYHATGRWNVLVPIVADVTGFFKFQHKSW